MQEQYPVRTIHSSGVDRSKWDDCVRRDPCALVYLHSWFLDAMAEDWYGVVLGDYRAVLPVPVKRKLGLGMVAMPPFVQRLGIAGTADPGAASRMAEALLQKGSIIQYSSSTPCLRRYGGETTRRNLLLPLGSDYEIIFQGYTAGCRKNLNQARKRGCNLAEDLNLGEVIGLYQDAYGDRSAYRPGHFALLEQMVRSIPQDCFHIAGVRDDGGKLVYGGLLMDDGKRVYYLLGAPTKEGRQMRATYFFIDTMIRRFAPCRAAFDFEGSEIPDVAVFYQSFSPRTEYYYQYYLNRLPFPFRWLADLKFKP